MAWYRRHARDLPWRNSRDPYRVWVSEIMLQQTQVATVIPYFERFVAAFPTVAELAAASEDQVLRLWEGLGYYRRARQLHQAAQIIVMKHGCQFPSDSAELQSLPGIGRYTAGAILSIAFDQSHPILEANTVRLFSRLLAYRGDTNSSEGKKRLWEFAAEIVPHVESGTFNQALMELGSIICAPRDPQCEICPAARLCPTRALGLQSQIPAAQPKAKYEDAHEACVVVWRDGKVLLRRCSDGERWAGLWDFPRFPVKRSPRLTHQLVTGVQRLTGIEIDPDQRLTTIKHGVTRFRITLDCYHARWRGGKIVRNEMRWVQPGGLVKIPLSKTARKISHLLTNTHATGPGPVV
jgi:A/G-specific adenine glycosylase